jgi:hypothetical protein
MINILFVIALLLLPEMALAAETAHSPLHINLTHHIVGYLSLAVTVLAYVAAMTEDVIELRKSKPMVLGSALI